MRLASGTLRPNNGQVATQRTSAAPVEPVRDSVDDVEDIAEPTVRANIKLTTRGALEVLNAIGAYGHRDLTSGIVTPELRRLAKQTGKKRG